MVHTVKGPFRRSINIDLKLITCTDKIVILSIPQSYLIHWYHTYILNPGMDITESIVCKHLYWPKIRDAFQKEVNNYDSCQRAKQSNKKKSIIS